MKEWRGKMTYEEALKLLNDMQFKDKYQGKDEYTDMLLACKQALDKQIPKKPIIDEEKFAICPSCKADVTDIYCGVCGQRIDWSDEE